MAYRCVSPRVLEVSKYMRVHYETTVLSVCSLLPRMVSAKNMSTIGQGLWYLLHGRLTAMLFSHPL